MIDIRDDIWTISNEMRGDIYNYFISVGRGMCIAELGAYKGYTTRFLAKVFQTVYAIDNNTEWLEENRKYNLGFNNIKYIDHDLYRGDWSRLGNVGNVGVVFIDGIHEYENCKSDTINSLNTFKNLKYIIYDDYGVFPGVKKLVNEFVRKGVLSIVSLVGLTSIPTLSGVNVVNTHEGVICKIINR